MQAYSTLLFDLDDTLIDFYPSEDTALDYIHAHYFFMFDKGHYKTTYRQINRALWDLVDQEKARPAEIKYERFKQLSAALKISFDIEEVTKFFEQKLGEQVVWLPGAQETLTQMKKHYKLGVITNGLTAVQEEKYRIGSFEQWCDCFLISEKFGIAKPDPQIFNFALQSLSSSPKQTLMVGDSLQSDFRGALNAGLDFCWINPHKKTLPDGWPLPKYNVASVFHLFKLIYCDNLDERLRSN